MRNLIKIGNLVTTPTLFKRTTTGKIQCWFLEISGPKYRTHSGQLFGKTVISEWTTAKPKNEGRSNATTAEQQAVAEVWAAFEKKLRDGYADTKISASASTDFFPMLAPTKSYDSDAARKKNVLAAMAKHGRVWIQPKLDGVRCLAYKDVLLSRKRREFVATPHIQIALEPFFADFPDIILDGEFYQHALNDDFNKIISLCRPTKPSPEELDESADLVEYWVFDLFEASRADVDYSNRFEILSLLETTYGSSSVKLVPTHECTSESELDHYYAEFLEQGFEGAMIRTPGPYEPGKRSKHLTKRKEMEDNEYALLDVCEGEGNRSEQAGYVIIKLRDGRTQKAGIKGDQAFRVELLMNKAKYIGHPATIQHFAQLTPDGKLRFPTLKAVYSGRRKM